MAQNYHSGIECAQIELFVPTEDQLVKILQDELRQHFVDVTVEWSLCPDLTQAPFNLAAPGLCGNEALVEMGSTSNLFPVPQRNRTFVFRNLLEYINRERCNSLVFRSGVCQKLQSEKLGELIMNAYFISLNGIWNNSLIRNKSKPAFVSGATAEPLLQEHDDSNPRCSMQGNFFISDDKPGPVFKIQAKKQTGNLDFVQAIQTSLNQVFPRTKGRLHAIVGLGGTFVVNNSKLIHYVSPCYWPNLVKHIKSDCDLHLCYSIDSPVTAVGTLINTNILYIPDVLRNKITEVSIRMNHFHGYSPRSGGHFQIDTESWDTVEYLGYFRPATMFYGFDLFPTCLNMPEFSYRTSCW